MVSLVVYDPPEVARARATSRLTSDTVSSLAGADRVALVLAVAKDDDLRFFERRERTAKRASEECQRSEEPGQNTIHGLPGCKRIMPGQRTRPNYGHPQVSWLAIA